MSHPLLKATPPITFWDSVKAIKLTLWDEKKQKLVSFYELKKSALEVQQSAFECI